MPSSSAATGPGPSDQARRQTPYVPRPELEDGLRAALANGRPVLVAGTAGAGKSRLVASVLADRPHGTASAAQSRHPTTRDLLVVLLSQEPEPHRALLRVLEGRGSLASRGEEEAAVLRAAALHLAAGPLARPLVLEDLELLDPTELRLLLSVLDEQPGCWVLVSRAHPESWRGSVVPVGPLSDSEARELVVRLLPTAEDAFVEAVVAQTGGIPLWIEQCVGLLDSAPAGQSLGVLRSAPRSMRDFVGMRLDALPRLERDLLDVAAVLGDGAEVDLLRHLSGFTERTLDETLSALESRSLMYRVRSEQDVDRIGFSHALVQEISYEVLSARRRVEIHRAAADWYAVLPVSQVLESQAHHLEQAVLLGTPDCDLVRRTVDAMVLFARSVEEERSRVCDETLRRARSIADEHPECAPDVLGLQLATSAVCNILGRYDEALEASGRALELAGERDDLRSLAEAHLLHARGLGPREPAAVEDHLTRAERGFGKLGDVGGQARVEIERSWIAQHASGIAHQLSTMERAYSLAMRSADARLQASMAQDLAMHHAMARGRPAFDQWAVRARDNSRADDVTVEPKLLLARSCLAMFDANPSEGLPHSTAALHLGRDLGLHFVYRNALVTQLDHLVRSGALVAARDLVPEAYADARRSRTPWHTLQINLLEAQLLQREGRTSQAQELLAQVARDPLAERAVLQRDLAEARGWVALDRGQFAEARAHAAQALHVDQETDERCAPMRPRLIDVVGAVAAGQPVPLGDIATFRQEGRETGLTSVVGLASRWMYVEELSRGWAVDLYGLEDLDVVEARALDLEIQALSTRAFELLAEAAAVWAVLGATVWHARALLWHSELTGTPHPEATELLDVLQAPDGLEQELRGQVRSLQP